MSDGFVFFYTFFRLYPLDRITLRKEATCVRLQEADNVIAPHGRGTSVDQAHRMQDITPVPGNCVSLASADATTTAGSTRSTCFGRPLPSGPQIYIHSEP